MLLVYVLVFYVQSCACWGGQILRGVTFEAGCSVFVIRSCNETRPGVIDFARVQHCLIPPEALLVQPRILFPLLVRVVRAIAAGGLKK